jgi:RNA polymerase sigma-70 factor (ECF subfamily)
MRLIRLKKDPPSDDTSLIETYRRTGDKEVIGILFERYAALVFGVCMKYLKNEDDCKDAVLQIFEKLMTDLKKYEISKFSSWLHSVAKNYCLMQLRNKEALFHRTAALKEQEQFMESVREEHLEEAKINEFYLSNLEEAISSLNEEQKVCIELFYLREESYQDIADLTGYNLNQVKSYIQNGKRNLRIYLLKKNHESAR